MNNLMIIILLLLSSCAMTIEDHSSGWIKTEISMDSKRGFKVPINHKLIVFSISDALATNMVMWKFLCIPNVYIQEGKIEYGKKISGCEEKVKPKELVRGKLYRAKYQGQGISQTGELEFIH
ncbi:MAG: hypothetical protein SFU98_12215 [Leptospiraceae bacterium]|nr:hypothetical protein [Leptospiraceae bacterium]